MKMSFKKASKTQSRLRLALVGPSGAGKTFTALRLAKGLGQKIALIDTERGSASKYSGDVVDFDVLELESFAPRMYVEAIKAAEEAGYDVLIIDSLSHAWTGKGGALEMVDKAAKRSQSNNSFAAWRDVTPEHNALVDAILGARMHIIATMRAKTEYVIEEVNGKRTPKKIGLAPVQRDGLEYEFDVVADVNLEHDFMVSKTRCAVLDKAVIREAGEEVAEILKRWLTDGAPRQEKPKAVDEVLAVITAAKNATDVDVARALANARRAELGPDDKRRVKAALDDADARIKAAIRAMQHPADDDDGGWLAPSDGDAPPDNHQDTETSAAE
jgi:hypothetical protein